MAKWNFGFEMAQGYPIAMDEDGKLMLAENPTLQALIEQFRTMPPALQGMIIEAVQKPQDTDLLAIMADWLEENGKCEAADKIRKSVETMPYLYILPGPRVVRAPSELSTGEVEEFINYATGNDLTRVVVICRHYTYCHGALTKWNIFDLKDFVKPEDFGRSSEPAPDKHSLFHGLWGHTSLALLRYFMRQWHVQGETGTYDPAQKAVKDWRKEAQRRIDILEGPQF